MLQPLRVLFSSSFPSMLLMLPVLLLIAQLCLPPTVSAAPATATEQGGQLRFNYYGTRLDEPLYLILVEKDRQRLSVYKLDQQLIPVRSFTCATGESRGIKTASGDARTPEGVYFITEIYEDKKITVFGSRAFHLDYPNPFDKTLGHQGDGIFIHGTNKALIPYSTNGCIALSNHDLDELAPYLSIASTPVVIVASLEKNPGGMTTGIQPGQPQFTAAISEIYPGAEHLDHEQISALSFLQVGDQAVASLDYDEYDGRFIQYRYHRRVYLSPGVSTPWRTVHGVESQQAIPSLLARKPLKNLHSGKDTPVVTLTSPKVVVHKEVLVASATPAPTPSRTPTYHQTKSAAPHKPVAEWPARSQQKAVAPATPKVSSPARLPAAAPVGLIAGLNSNSRRSSQNGGSQNSVAKAPPVAPAPPAPAITAPVQKPAPAPPKLDLNKELLAFIEKWRTAWTSKDLTTYMSCYAPDFTSAGLDKAKWRAKKSYLNSIYRYINVTVRNISVEWTKDGAKVSFYQKYQSDKYTSTGTKVLTLINRDNRWMIYREAM